MSQVPKRADKAIQLLEGLIEQLHYFYNGDDPKFKKNVLKDAVKDLTRYQGKIQKIQVRPGEKFHETLINQDEIAYTYESKEDYIIRSPGVEEFSDIKSRNLKKVKFTSTYSSDKVPIISKNEMKKIIQNEKLL